MRKDIRYLGVNLRDEAKATRHARKAALKSNAPEIEQQFIAETLPDSMGHTFVEDLANLYRAEKSATHDVRQYTVPKGLRMYQRTIITNRKWREEKARLSD